MKANYSDLLRQLPEDSLVGQYLRLVSSMYSGAHECSDSISFETIREAPLANRPSFSPFLTVITRTQGRRKEALEEMLLGLAAQTNMNFLVHMIGHNLDEKLKQDLLILIDRCPVWIRDRITVSNVNGGGRSHPLNAALESLVTPYFSILDDDDVVFDNWAETFISTAQEHSGRIIHSGVFSQEWESLHLDGVVVNRSASSPDPYFCMPYNSILQFQANACPTMGLAYPSFIANDLGMRFDETLSTVEDWDFLMHAVILCGVQESGENTAIYRLWKNANTSHDMHDDEEWEANRIKVKEKLDGLPLLLAPGAIDQLCELSKTGAEVEIPPRQAQLKLVYMSGGYSCLLPNAIEYDPGTRVNTVRFEIPDNCTLGAMTFYPVENGQVTLVDLAVDLEFSNGRALTLYRNDLIGNGYNPTANEWAFIRPPEITLKLADTDRVRTCVFSFKFRNAVAPEVLESTKLAMRARSSLRRKGHHLKGILRAN